MYDVFICHASEDKNKLVRPLAKQLSEVYKVKVWYDEFSLEYGDSLLESIEKGLQKSSFGIVILSEKFFNKMWTNHEYTSLRTKEMLLNEKVVIPIWFKVDSEKIAKYSLTLVDKLAYIINDTIDIDDIAIEMIKIVRPDIYDNISRMRYFEYLINKSKRGSINNVEMKKIQAPPIRHQTLSTIMKARLKLVYNAIKDVDDRRYIQYEEDFRRNTNIDREIVITERITAAYLDCINQRNMTDKERLHVYLFTLTLGKFKQRFSFNENEIKVFSKIIKSYIEDINADLVVEYRFEDKND